MKASFTYENGTPTILLDPAGDQLDAAALCIFQMAVSKGVALTLTPGADARSPFRLGLVDTAAARKALSE